MPQQTNYNADDEMENLHVKMLQQGFATEEDYNRMEEIQRDIINQENS